MVGMRFSINDCHSYSQDFIIYRVPEMRVEPLDSAVTQRLTGPSLRMLQLKHFPTSGPLHMLCLHLQYASLGSFMAGSSSSRLKISVTSSKKPSLITLS